MSPRNQHVRGERASWWRFPRLLRRRASSKPSEEQVSFRQRVVNRVRQARQWFAERRVLWLRMGYGLATVAIASGGVWLADVSNTYLRTSDAFAIKTIEVEGNRRVGRAELLEHAGLSLGQNIFEFEPAEFVRKVESLDWVKKASSFRKLPNEIQIQIEEYTPVAIWLTDQMYFVDNRGTRFKAVELEDSVDLPMITGVHTASAALVDQQMRSAVALLELYERFAEPLGTPVGEVHFDTASAVTLVVGDPAIMVRVGPPPFETKLRRLQQVLVKLQNDHQQPLHVFLDHREHADRVSVRLR